MVSILKKISLVILLIFLCSCNHNLDNFSEKVGGVVLENEMIKLIIDTNFRIKITDKSSGKPINTLTEKPSNYPIIDEVEITNFNLDKSNIQLKEIKNEFGNGKQLTLTGTGVFNNIKMLKTLTITMPFSFPKLFITNVKYKNEGEEVISVNNLINNSYVLDASVSDSSKKPFDFWSYQGASTKWGKDYVTQIIDSCYEKNYMGEQAETKTGGGNPIIDIWNKDIGIAIAHIETKPKLVSFPIEVQGDKRVCISMSDDKLHSLKPGESVKSLTTITIVHELDYFNPLKTYSKLMSLQGIRINKPTNEAYEPIWCGWGYEFNFTPDEIIGTLPMVEKLGINWVVIDDRWFDKYGDWNPREDNFLNGDQQMKNMVSQIHQRGHKTKIWWLPTAAQGTDKPPESKPWINWDFQISEVAKKHPNWFIRDKNGDISTDSRYLWNLCPALPDVQEYIKKLTIRFIKDWDYDGHKLDAYYIVPPCYDLAHNHAYPEESYEKLPELFRIIYETTKELKPDAVVELCNCGTTQDFFQSVWTDQPVVSDPLSAHQVRRRIKSMKALWGSDAPVYADQVEFLGEDFASGVGPGGVIGTKFTWPYGRINDFYLSPKMEKHWLKWISLYKEKMLPKGEYLNLYDIIYDKPETHAIKKNDTIYYSFFDDYWSGEIELRGLEKRNYIIRDYVNNILIREIYESGDTLNIEFKNFLLIECVPVD